MPLLSRFYQLKKSRQYNVVSKNLLTVKVELLDGTPVECTLLSESTGHECLVNVCQRFGIKQCEFFGLQYVSKLQPGHRRWLDLERPLKQQLHRLASSHHIYFGVVFYVTDVNLLHDEMTRSQYYLQLKNDVQEGRLHASYEQAVMLASYGLQVELADYDADRHSLDRISKLSLFPKHMVEDEQRRCTLYEAARQTHATLRGLSQQLAELYFIMEVQQLEGYGQQHFLCRDERGDDTLVGASLTGIVVRKVGSHCSRFYRWQEIANLHNQKRNFGVELSSGSTVQFTMAEKSLAKYVWKISVLQHKFFKIQRASLNQTDVISQLPPPDVQATASKCRSPAPPNHPLLKPSSAAGQALGCNLQGRLVQRDGMNGRVSGEPGLSVNSDVTHRLPPLLKQKQNRSLSDDAISCILSGGHESDRFIRPAEQLCVQPVSSGVSGGLQPVARKIAAVRHRSQPDVFNTESLQLTRHSDRSVYGNFTDLSRLSAADSFRRGPSNTPASNLTYSTPELAACAESAVHGSGWEPNNNNNERRASLDPLSREEEAKLHHPRHSPPPYSRTSSSSTPNLLSLQCAGPDLITSSTLCVNKNNNTLIAGVALSSTQPSLDRHQISASVSQHSQNFISSEELDLVYRVGAAPSDCFRSEPRPSLSVSPPADQPIYANLSPPGSMQSDLRPERRSLWSSTGHPGPADLQPDGPPSWTRPGGGSSRQGRRPGPPVGGSATLRRLKETLLVASRLHSSSSSARGSVSSGSSSSSHVPPNPASLSTVSRHEQCQALQERLNSSAFGQEFEAVIKRRDSAEYTTACRPENIPRNRYSDIVPYEDNRVRVTPSRQNPCGYLNASHVSVSVGDRQCFYIAGQSPQANSLLDFWRAVWENHVPLVLMFGGEEAPALYWPQADGGLCRFGGEVPGSDVFEVQRRASTRGAAHLTSQLSVSRRRDGSASAARTLWHVQCRVGWAGSGDPGAFVQLLQEVNALAAPDTGPGQTAGPVLVHCEAGVGATGVAIMCHVLLHCVDHNVPVQPQRLLLHLRQQRMLMVQTLKQYRFVYQVLIHYLGGSRLI